MLELDNEPLKSLCRCPKVLIFHGLFNQQTSHVRTNMKTSTFFYLLTFLPAILAAPMPLAVPVSIRPLASRDGISFIDCSECHYGYTALPNGAYTCEANVQVYCSP